MKKSIVFVIESLHLGGAEKSLVTLLQNLDYNLFDVELLTFHAGGFFSDLLPSEVQRIVVPFPKLSLIDRGVFKLKRFLNFKHYHNAQLFWPIVEKYFKANEKRYDFAIAYNQGFSTYYTAKFLNANLKYTWLNTDYKSAGYNIAFDYPFYTNYNKVIVVSKEAEQSFKSVLSSIKKHLTIEVIKDITDKNIIQAQAEKPLKHSFNVSKINILSVGRLVSPKGFDLAVKACSYLMKSGLNVNWYILGEGVERSNLERQIKQHHLEKHFILLGADSNPYPYMKACDIYVQTSLFEGLGLTVIEASYLNKPIVSTNFPTVYGILKDEETGLIAEMNAEAIAKKIERLITDKALRETLVSNLEEQENTDKQVTLKQIDLLLNI